MTMTGQANTSIRSAAAIQAPCHPSRAATATKLIGRMASPSWWPGTTRETARPRLAANQRPVWVRAIWVIMPCPNRRSSQIATPHHGHMRRESHEQARTGQKRQRHARHLPAVDIIKHPSGPGQDQSAGQRRAHIDQPELAFAQIKPGAQVIARKSDEEGLAERGEESQQQAGDQPARIGADEIPHVGAARPDTAFTKATSFTAR